MKLEQENHEPILNATWSDVESALLSIHPKNHSFIILSNKKGSYVQTAGARLRLIIEHRQKSIFGFKHIVFGNPPENSERISINYSGGAISLNRSEILTVDDAISIFRAFFEGKEVPEKYLTRDVTNSKRTKRNSGEPAVF
jgi:hypothetical protein